MTDYFAALRQPRRPWLDTEALKERYQRLAAEHHPDRQSRDAKVSPTFAEVNEAYRVLSDPKLRLQHLLEVEGYGAVKTSEIASELAEVFMEAADLVGQIDDHLRKQKQATSALSKSLLQAETMKLQKSVDGLLERLQQSYSKAEQELRRADQLWMEHGAASFDQLRTLADRFGYLERWIGQLRERQFQLSS